MTLAQHWSLDPEIRFLNHGSFGACPKPILEYQRELSDRMEREPVLFLGRDIEPLLDEARDRLGRFVGANPDDLAFVTNATTGVNTVLRSLTFEPGDQLLVTDHEYNACRNAIDVVAERAEVEVVVVALPLPVRSSQDVVDAVVAAVTERTVLLLIDNVTSPTGMVLPVEQIVPALAERGIDTLVDGAHAPGMLPLELDALGAAYYTGNCHKWLCTPKGSAFLHVRRDRQPSIRPLVISHGANSTRTDRSRFRVESDWVGTLDPTAWLCIPKAIDFLGSLLPGGFDGLRRHNRDLALRARELIRDAVGLEAVCPDDMIGSLASMRLPDGPPGPPPLFLDPLHRWLFDERGIEVPVMPWPRPPGRLIRISAQAYNELDQYEYLAAALRDYGVGT